MMSDTCGLTSCEPFAKWDHDSQCWKTSEATSLWALTLSSLTLPQWGGLHNGELCEHPTPERLTSGLDYSSLPTPVADHSRGLPSSTTDYASLANVAATLLPTPAVNDMGEGKTLEWWDEWAPRQMWSDGRPAPHGRSLAIEAQRMLPTPRAQNGEERNSNIWERPLNQPQNLENALARIGATTGQRLAAGKQSSDDEPQRQLSLDSLALPA